MKFIGRRRELESLETAYQTDGGFVVIYGRRRVGKTTLIKEFIKDKLAFYFLATEEVESQSMKRLASVAARITKNPMLQRVAFSDWLDLFRVISEYRPEEKKVLVIDEFPYLVKSNPAFPSILQNAWDEILKDSNVMLILCGSLIGMMQKYAQEGPQLFPDGMTTDQPERQVMGEILREKLLLCLDKEIPHGTAVEITKFSERDSGVIDVDATIYCEKASHKGIIIGKQGAMLKKISSLARQDMEKFMGTKVYLETWVKVKENWRDNVNYVRSFGYRDE